MDLRSQIIAALLGPPTQAQRLIRLHTVLGPDVLLAERVEIDERIGPGPDEEEGFAGTRLVVHAVSLDAHLELKRLIGQPALLELLTAASRTALRPWHGHVTRAELVGSDGGLARFRLTIEPWLAFLAHTRDAWVFQHRTVQAIVEEVFADHVSQGRLAPAWRWELADPGVYPERSLCIQYQESDLAFVQRLLREEGLYAWFEHVGDPASATFGSHTLVIADHHGAFRPNVQPVVRYTQSRLGFVEDTLTRWQQSAHLRTARLSLASPDHRALDLRPVAQAGVGGSLASLASCQPLSSADIPGAYAYEDKAQGERLALRQMQAIDARREQARATTNVRSMAPATTFTLVDHPLHDGLDGERDRFVVLSARHRARNNLAADQCAFLETLGGSMRPGGAGRAAAVVGGAANAGAGRRGAVVGGARGAAANRRNEGVGSSGGGVDGRYEGVGGSSGGGLDGRYEGVGGSSGGGGRGGTLDRRSFTDATDEPLYTCEILAQRAAVPVRLAGVDASGQPDPRLHPRPTVRGLQTALVVGLDAPVHTDRDHRIKVQFHWQRGADASHRLEHPSGRSNAPASDASGTWVRVGESVAGANWGTNFVPRLGQEVLVAFVEGDIDRPIVIGSLYNGQGRADAQGNQLAGGAASSTGSAPAWFPGSAAEGRLEGHRHAAVLAGFKSQELGASRSGAGGHNHLAFDDTPGASRIELASTDAASRLSARLQLGHLLQQTDNRRLQPRGHGFDLASEAWGAVRAGRGLLLSAHGRPGSQGDGAQLDAREPQASLAQALGLLHALAERGQRRNARLDGEPDGAGAVEDGHARRLPVEQAHRATATSLGAMAGGGAGGDGGTADGVAARGGAAGGAAATDGAARGSAAGGKTFETGSATAIGGGTGGGVAAWGRPDLVLAAPGGIACFTPAASVYCAGNTLSLVATQDVQHLTHASASLAAQDGIVVYTDGRADVAGKPNQETGLRLHAASGSVQTQSQNGSTKLTADSTLEVSSTAAQVLVTAPKSILMTAGGAALDLQAGSITLKGPGKIEFKAAMKVIDGPMAASAHFQRFAKPADVRFDERFIVTNEAGKPLPRRRYQIVREDGGVLSGVTDERGRIEQQHSARGERVEIRVLGKA